MQDRWIWPFELIEKVGEGGMGVVYRARYVQNNMQVAVKLITQDITDATILSRFERELDILKTLRHPNIVYCFGGVCENKRRFYAMELVDAGTLDRLLQKRGRFTWMETVEYAKQMCAALAYAHARGVIHRDVKPGNFLLTRAGKLKLSDFGLATVIAARRITADGRTLGTLRYMAPEQVRGLAVSAQTDLYALGCVLFELLTGRTPFSGNTAAEIMQQHVQRQPPRVSDFISDCPEALEQLIDDLLKKEITDRPASALAVGERLQLINASSIARPTPRATDARARAPVERAMPARDEVWREMPSNVRRAGICALIALLLLLSWNLSLVGPARRADQADATVAKLLEDRTPQVRLAAIRSLQNNADPSPATVEAIKTRLTDTEPLVREAAVVALGGMKAAARSAIPELTRIQQKDEFPTVRVQAGTALEAIRGEQQSGSSWPYWVAVLVLIGAAAVLAYRHYGWPWAKAEDDRTVDAPTIS